MLGGGNHYSNCRIVLLALCCLLRNCLAHDNGHLRPTRGLALRKLVSTTVLRVGACHRNSIDCFRHFRNCLLDNKMARDSSLHSAIYLFDVGSSLDRTSHFTRFFTVAVDLRVL